jgi:hypothetical protein
MILTILLVLTGSIVCCFAWYIWIERGKGYAPLGSFSAAVLAIIAVGSLFFASVRLHFSPIAQVGLVAGVFIGTAFIMLFREMILEGFSSILPKKLSDKIFYIVFLITLIIILLMLIKIAYYSYITGTIPRYR